ncbi:unnamed protein product [Didymodactylos carnosus]|uniref:Uncharacterized protein n=1 Tax=Didymodactylos carnosus TaxID=1234261 RepID=A0A815ZD13_9BILA|nr:unnamed protein product [Didymodactylos carnosus]CAF1583440.1 unnamed protein product [Didymodactylos carnosus]CAF4231463.1 unnamed protein product [Didymodactylos carnosus]CAF4451791.1 unnamed protein product [Didymodactylos carnosus]
MYRYSCCGYQQSTTISNHHEFGMEIEQLVNITFSTSQSFPSLMNNYMDVIRYLKQELLKHYTTEEFIIIIGGTNSFNFDTDYGEYMAVVQQNNYKVLVYSTKRNLSSISKIVTRHCRERHYLEYRKRHYREDSFLGKEE